MDPAILSGSNPGLATYFAMFIGQSFLIIPVLYYLKSKKFNLIDSLRLNFVSSKIIYATVFISIGAMILSDEINILVGMVIPIPDSFLQIEALLKPENPFSLALLIITIVIIAPIGEELLFRGFLQKSLEKAWNDVTRAILFSSLFFCCNSFQSILDNSNIFSWCFIGFSGMENKFYNTMYNLPCYY